MTGRAELPGVVAFGANATGVIAMIIKATDVDARRDDLGQEEEFAGGHDVAAVLATSVTWPQREEEEAGWVEMIALDDENVSICPETII